MSKQKFDPDCLRFSASDYRLEGEVEVAYTYLGGRLMDLYEESEDPTPRGVIDVWLKRRSGARHVMLATIAGVIIAIVLGVLSLAVAIFQAWIAYEQWKTPPASS